PFLDLHQTRPQHRTTRIDAFHRISRTHPLTRLSFQRWTYDTALYCSFLYIQCVSWFDKTSHHVPRDFLLHHTFYCSSFVPVIHCLSTLLRDTMVFYVIH